MDLGRGELARIDRKLLAGLGRDETYRMARVPVTPAKWLTWKRYCDSAGISMGRAMVALIDRELARVAESSGGDSPVLARRVREQLASREDGIASRERAVASAEDTLRGRAERLRRWEADLQTQAQRVEMASKLAAHRRDAVSNVGRNERCPCGSGLKNKHCHGGSNLRRTSG